MKNQNNQVLLVAGVSCVFAFLVTRLVHQRWCLFESFLGCGIVLVSQLLGIFIQKRFSGQNFSKFFVRFLSWNILRIVFLFSCVFFIIFCMPGAGIQSVTAILVAYFIWMIYNVATLHIQTLGSTRLAT